MGPGPGMGPPMRGMGFGRRHGPMSDEEKANVPKITKALVFRAFSYLKPYKLQLVAILLMLTVSSVFGLLPSMITGRIIDEGFPGFNGAGNFGLIVKWILISFAVLIASNLIGVLQNYVSTWMSQRIMFDMRNQMYKHIEHMSHRFFTNERQGDIITRMTSDISGVSAVISGTLQQIFSNIITLITTIVALFSQNWVLAIVGTVVVPLFILPTKIVGKKRFELAGEQQAKQDSMNQVLNETLSVSGSLLVKLFTKEQSEYKKYESINSDVVKLAIKESLVGRWFMMTIGIFTSIGPMLIYFTAGLLIFRFGHTELTVGAITVVVALIGRLYGPINALFNMQIDITRSMALFARIFRYFDLKHEITNKPDAKPADNLRGDIEFRDVSFSYTPETPVLRNVSFTVRRGTTVALVGPSGAGKSTIISLIPRLYDVTGGAVLIDGTDVRDLDMFALRANIGLVSQDTYLFNGTVRENLLYANETTTDAEIVEACRKANIHDFIESLPQKYDTIVGNRGLKLSGGEKQRVSIARVILKNPKILILDEATSSLDSISESLIQSAIMPLLEGRTSVVIAHRLSTIMEADEIIVLQNGTIQGRGAHRDLLNSNAVYTELYETQFARAIQDYIDNGSAAPQPPSQSQRPDRPFPPVDGAAADKPSRNAGL